MTKWVQALLACMKGNHLGPVVEEQPKVVAEVPEGKVWRRGKYRCQNCGAEVPEREASSYGQERSGRG